MNLGFLLPVAPFPFHGNHLPCQGQGGHGSHSHAAGSWLLQHLSVPKNIEQGVHLLCLANAGHIHRVKNEQVYFSSQSLFFHQEDALAGSSHSCSSRLRQWAKPGLAWGSLAFGGLGGSPGNVWLRLPLLPTLLVLGRARVSPACSSCIGRYLPQ